VETLRLINQLPENSTLPNGMYAKPEDPLKPLIPALADMRTRPVRKAQQELSRVASSHDYLLLREKVQEEGLRTQAWLASVTSPTSIGGDFMRCIPSHAPLQLNPALFARAGRLHYMQPQMDPTWPIQCYRCLGGVDAEGTHYLACRPAKEHCLGTPMIRSHDAVKRVLARCLREVYHGNGRVKEEDRHSGGSPRHIPDITVRDHDHEDGTLLVEVSHIRPFAPKHLSNAAVGTAVAKWERHRRNKHYPSPPTGYTMVPFIFDVFGALGPESAKFLNGLAATMKELGASGERGEALTLRRGETWGGQWKCRLSMTLAREMARTIHERIAVESSGATPHDRNPAYVRQNYRR
jgi:hypothetical protein